jgi:hypothetical protein
MSRIIGNEETIKRIKEAQPGDACVYVNMEAILQLPDDFEATPAKVEFDPEKDFTNLGSDAKQSMYPSTRIMYLVSDARGISLFGQPEIELLYEEVNISEMEMVATPVIQKKKVGYVVKKTGYVVQDDGTPRTSGHIGIFNAWDECSKLWASEERWTEGYTKKGKYDNKYDTKWKRRVHFQEMLDNSLGQADTKAWLKCIRDLAGLLTGYTKEQIKGGKFYFMKIRRSEAVRKAETAARLQAISNGGSMQLQASAQPQLSEPKSATFEPEPEPVTTSAPVSGTTSDGVEFSVEEDTPQATMNGILAQIKTKREKAIYTLKHYLDTGMILEKYSSVTTSMIAWLEGHPTAETLASWAKAIGLIQAIEKDIPEQGQVTHGLYEKEIF